MEKTKLLNQLTALPQTQITQGLTLSYAPSSIKFEGKIYNLQVPLRCAFEQEENYYIIKNELLDIVGTGLNPEEAENSFFQEFAYIYTRYNELPNEKLSNRILQIKNILNFLVKTVA